MNIQRLAAFAGITLHSAVLALGAPVEDISKTAFVAPQAAEAQSAYNKAVEEAWRRYQTDVAKAAAAYAQALKSAYKTEVEKDNLEEAMKLRDEIQRMSADLQAGLVLYYSFDRPGPNGQIPDLSGKGNNGVLEGSRLVPTGKVAGACQFNIQNRKDRVIVRDSDTLDCKHVTIAAWIKSADKDEFWNRILDKDWKLGYNLCLGGAFQQQRFDGKVFFEMGEDAHIGSDAVVADGNWHHVAATYDGQAMRMYIDGRIQKAVRKIVKDIAVNAFDIGIGNSRGGPDQNEFLGFDGLIDELRIYNRALSEKEVLLLFQGN